MQAEAEIAAYLAGLPPAQAADLARLHQIVAAILPDGPVRLLDGRDATGKVVTNPAIAHGACVIPLAGGRGRDSHRIGLAATRAGISIHLMSIRDRAWLAATHGARLPAAQMTGYCLRFRRLADLDLSVLEDVLRDAAARG